MSAKTQRDHRKPSDRGGTQHGGTDLLPHSGDGSAARLRTVTYTCVYYGIVRDSARVKRGRAVGDSTRPPIACLMKPQQTQMVYALIRVQCPKYCTIAT
jgi:hypothetical protein